MRVLILCLAIVVTLCGCDTPPAATSQPAADRPAGPPPRWNILLVSLDTTRKDHLSAYGYGRPTTPVLEKLVADGHRFDAAYTVMPTTLPAHVAMFTSCYPGQFAVRQNGHILTEDAVTLPELLAEAGVRTGGFVSATPIKTRSGFAQGFETYSEPRRAERTADETCDAALAWLADDAGDGPWFCFLHLFDPHTWYEPPAETAELFDAPTKHEPRVRGFIPGGLEQDKLTSLVNAYDAEIRFADNQIGRLIEWLDRSGQRDRTIIMVTADHGETLLETGPTYVFSHGGELRHCELNVPLILWLPPQFEAGRGLVHATPVSLLDIVPTLLDLLGRDWPDECEGLSLGALLAGSTLPPRSLFAELKSGREAFSRDSFAVLDGEWLMIKNNRHTSPVELFHLASDPRAEQDKLRGNRKIAGAARQAAQDLRDRLEQKRIVERPMLERGSLEALESLGYVGGDDEEEEEEP